MVLKFASTMKPDFVARQLRWTRDPMEVRRLVTRRAEIYEEIIGEQTVKALENGSRPLATSCSRGCFL